MALLRDKALLGAFLVATAYGFSDEFHQRFVPGRFSDFYDFLADACGALLFVGVYWLFMRKRQPASSS